MAEYIEREAAKKALADSGLVPKYRADNRCVTDRIIDAVPAADVAPVVRCEECKHYKEFRTKRHKQIMRLCYRMGKHDMEYSVKPDDFCSYGEPR